MKNSSKVKKGLRNKQNKSGLKSIHIFTNSQNLLKYSNCFILFFILILTIVLVRTAWVCDDAYITFRTVDNFINGYGLTWNVTERVQAYTHPLWMFLISFLYFFTREVFFSSIFLSLILSISAVSLIAFKISKNTYTSILAITILLFSKSFTDYSTSGLENSLSYFLAVIYIIYFLKEENNYKSILRLSFIVSLATLNRMDTILLYLPSLIFVLYQSKKIKNIVAVLIGFTPFILWEVFSLVYYGFPFPNTAYAKLGNIGISTGELIIQGFYYFVNSFSIDPITLIAILVILTFLIINRNSKNIFLSCGVILYLIYVCKIGGDFMSGRFFALPLIIIISLIASYKFDLKIYIKALILTSVIIIGILSPFNPLFSGGDYREKDTIQSTKDNKGINDERGFYYKTSNLLGALKGSEMPNHGWVLGGVRTNKDKSPIDVLRSIGYYGYFVGPNTHLIDQLALADPLLARLPRAQLDSSGNNFGWTIGHFLRVIPEGYIGTLLTSRNVITDSNLAKYYDKLSLIIKGKIFSFNRFTEIFKFNFGMYNNLITEEKYTKIDKEELTSTNQIRLVDEVIKFRPDIVQSYNIRANYFFSKKDYSRAIQDFKKVMVINKNNPTIDTNIINITTKIAECYYELKNYDSVVYYCDEILKINKSSYNLLAITAISYMNLKEYQNALPLFLELLEYESQRTIDIYRLSVCYYCLNDIINAIRYADIAVSKGFSLPNGYYSELKKKQVNLSTGTRF